MPGKGKRADKLSNMLINVTIGANDAAVKLLLLISQY